MDCINNCSSPSKDATESWLEEFIANNFKHSVFYSLLMVLLYAIVFIVGIIGNSLVIIVIAKKSHMRTVTNLFLFNLAVADMFVIVFCLPATLVASVIRSWILGSFMCWGVAYVQGISVVASAFSLAAISIDRCKAICKSTPTTQGFSNQQAKIVILVIWILAVIVPLPWAFVFVLQVSEAPGHPLICTENWSSEELDILYYLLGNLFSCYVLPFLLILSANVKIWVKVSKRKQPGTSSSGSVTRHKNHRNKRQGVGKMLGVVTLTYLISWLPLYVLATRMKLSKSTGETEAQFLLIVIPLAQWLAYWNSCVNPIFYAFFNPSFRKMGRRFLPSWMFNRFSIRKRSCSGRERRAALIGRDGNKSDIAQEKSCSVTGRSAQPSLNTVRMNEFHNEVQKLRSPEKHNGSNPFEIKYDVKIKANEQNKPLLFQTNSVKITAV